VERLLRAVESKRAHEYLMKRLEEYKAKKAKLRPARPAPGS